MELGILNELGYFEVIEISIWLGLMYFGKCWVDNYFKNKSEKCCINKGKECPGWDVDASEDGQSIIPCEHEECKTTNKKWRVHEIEDQEDLWY
jgi:hypothetical protein|tara:strand:- start:503 stop:781 length:279 start_codon:yes stop_codon:yes gene_type:complete